LVRRDRQVRKVKPARKVIQAQPERPDYKAQKVIKVTAD
jgi:hypothetical protein